MHTHTQSISDGLRMQEHECPVECLLQLASVSLLLRMLCLVIHLNDFEQLRSVGSSCYRVTGELTTMNFAAWLFVPVNAFFCCPHLQCAGTVACLMLWSLLTVPPLLTISVRGQIKARELQPVWGTLTRAGRKSSAVKNAQAWQEKHEEAK